MRVGPCVHCRATLRFSSGMSRRQERGSYGSARIWLLWCGSWQRSREVVSYAMPLRSPVLCWRPSPLHWLHLSVGASGTCWCTLCWLTGRLVRPHTLTPSHPSLHSLHPPAQLFVETSLRVIVSASAAPPPSLLHLLAALEHYPHPSPSSLSASLSFSLPLLSVILLKTDWLEVQEKAVKVLCQAVNCHTSSSVEPPFPVLASLRLLSSVIASSKSTAQGIRMKVAPRCHHPLLSSLPPSLHRSHVWLRIPFSAALYLEPTSHLMHSHY